MNALRHIAAIPSATEQRCIRCCAIISRKQQSTIGAAWPGAYVTEIGGKLFSGHAANGADCVGVDLNETRLERLDAEGVI